MIPYKLPEEKAFILRYAKLLNDDRAESIVIRDCIQSEDEAEHLARFFWKMVERSNQEDKKNDDNSESILEKIVITLMAYYHSSGFEEQWETVSDSI